MVAVEKSVGNWRGLLGNLIGNYEGFSRDELGVEMFMFRFGVLKLGYGLYSEIQDGIGRDRGAGVLQGVREGGEDGACGIGAQRAGNQKIGTKSPRDYQRGAGNVV